MLHGQRVSACVLHVWMGTCGCAAWAEDLCVCAARVDGSLWVCCTGKGSLCACCLLYASFIDIGNRVVFV